MNNNGLELIFRTFSDLLPESGTDAAYLFGQTICNQESSFQSARKSNAGRILVLDTCPRSGYPGYTSWKTLLVGLGVQAGFIEAVPMQDDLLLNSRTESQALIRHAINSGYKTIEIIAPPFHQVRAFMTTITIALEEQVNIALYSRPGTPLPWNERVLHSQGTLEAERSRLIHEEITRIQIYQDKRDLASFTQVLEYLNWRENR